MPSSDGRVFAVVRVQQRVQECSSAGGEHYVLELADGTRRLAHAGGHSIRLGLVSQRYMVAELVLHPPLDPDADGNPDSSGAGWCLDRLPRFAASATQLLPARDKADAQELLAQVQRLGFPPVSVTLAPPTPRDEIAVARVISLDPGARWIELQTLDGRGPDRLAITDHHQPRIGDLVVVASSSGKSTRVLFPEDLASARAWAAEIRHTRWPVGPIVIGYRDSVTTARWTTVATVVAGTGTCGPTIRAPHGYGTSLILPKLDAAAPPGAKLGDRVIAVVVARVTPDTCGHNTRVVRAYAAPKDVTLDTFHGVIPAGLVPIVE